MVKHTQTIRRLKSTNCLSVIDHFVRLAVKGLSKVTDLQTETLCEKGCQGCFTKILVKIFRAAITFTSIIAIGLIKQSYM